MSEQKKSNVNFKPWVGRKYKEGYKGKHILVLGESHYCRDELKRKGRCYPKCKVENMCNECHNKTKYLIKNFIEDYVGDKYQQTYLCFERAIAGKELNLSERKEFWNSIVFYNYVQYSLPASRVAPEQKQWEESESAFQEILGKYMPDYIIIWGARLYKKIPLWDGRQSSLSVDGYTTEVYTYKFNGKKIPAMKVIHPSCPRGKSWSRWHKFYVKFFSRKYNK